MNETESKKKEGRIIKLFFWFMIAPFMFLVFIRLFFILFSFLYAPVVLFVMGSIANNLLFALSAITALVFTVGAIAWIYKQLKIHIIKG